MSSFVSLHVGIHSETGVTILFARPHLRTRHRSRYWADGHAEIPSISLSWLVLVPVLASPQAVWHHTALVSEIFLACIRRRRPVKRRTKTN